MFKKWYSLPKLANQLLIINYWNILCNSGQPDMPFRYNEYFCNNIYYLISCNIVYTQATTCLTYDSLNCTLRKSIQPNKNIASKQRQNIRNYFMYAIQGSLQTLNPYELTIPIASNEKTNAVSKFTKSLAVEQYFLINYA